MLLTSKKEDRRIRRTKQDFKNTFIFLMREKPYENVTVTDIVEHADYNRTTFYRHYQDKEQLTEELVEDTINELIIAFRYPYRNSNYLRLDSLTPSNVIIFDYIRNNADIFSLWKKSNGIPGFKEKFIDTLIRLFKEDIIHFSNQSDEINHELFVIFRAYGVWGLIVNWIKNDFAAPSQEMAEQLIQIISYHPIDVYRTK